MKSNIFIPKKIKVGFNNRNDTYTKKLAYVIYYDEKGKLRKEASWQSWRDKEIEPQEFNNVPTEGFVLNKKVGDYDSGWSHRHAYTRVYDPRDFEFEITIENLLYILENANSIKGKGLEGQFVYGWDGKDLILIPVESPDYKEISLYNEKVHSKNLIQVKDLIIGATYKFKDNHDAVYLGKYQEANDENKETNSHFFYSEKKYSGIEKYKSISGIIIDCVNDKCVDNYAELMDKLIKSSYYSERDQKLDKYIPFTLEQFKEHLCNSYYSEHFYKESGVKYFAEKYRDYWRYNYSNSPPKYDVYNCDRNRKGERLDNELTIERVFEKYKPHFLATYKSDGKLIKEWRKKHEQRNK